MADHGFEKVKGCHQLVFRSKQQFGKHLAQCQRHGHLHFGYEAPQAGLQYMQYNTAWLSAAPKPALACGKLRKLQSDKDSAVCFVASIFDPKI